MKVEEIEGRRVFTPEQGDGLEREVFAIIDDVAPLWAAVVIVHAVYLVGSRAAGEEVDLVDAGQGLGEVGGGRSEAADPHGME